ncbi:unnamed protein product [Cladocopium goreaui]|uniref:Uncharacterized protein n=1 Tax=Cladocopium goreaui TaxID=2562237 RepID=A0A9P1FSF6_9DINO|nr:unnamed protein product [Cladocopium goreaui]
MDIMTPQGFAHALYQVLSLKPGSSLFLAPVCSTWVWVARGSTLRSEAMPLGWERYSSVLTANQMVARCCILMILAAARGIWVVCEQPKGSLMQFHPCFEAVMDLVPLWRKFIRMGDFGASSGKGTWLYSSRQEIEQLMEFQPQGIPQHERKSLVDFYVDSKGKQRVKGNAQLKLSQAYARAFGKALAKLRTKHLQRSKRMARALLKRAAGSVRKGAFKNTSHQMSFWVKHANLETVLEYLTS